ncbi:TPA: conjugal transfer protein TraN [Pseudomonas aeruginosa]|uniref:conjugal transfer protein TraN n=1 Tax=Pseudomonas aeruginosa TaxID=287 RepID=UPI00093FC399|nr:conjugal transfer protein TraN [Pseudomonas aeruginosa]HBO1620029.1 conjugal transfer protein TraN [Pseudomonas aeruginosa]
MFKLKPIVSAATLFFYCYSSLLPAWADAVSSSAAQGNAAANEALQNFSVPNVSDGKIIFGDSGSAQDIKLSDLFPGVSSGESKEQLESLYGDDQETLSIGGQANARLKVEESSEGDAYRVLLGTAQMTRPNIKNDPLWTNTDEAFNNQSTFEKEFADCKEENTVTETTTKKHVSDLKTCEKINDQSGKAILRHDYVPNLIRYKSGPTNIQSCGRGCLDVWIGTVGDNYWSGSCTIYEQQMVFEVMNPDAITKASLTYAKWDDYMQVWLGTDKVWAGPNNNFPPETAGPCELGTSWAQTLNVDITQSIKKAGDMPFKIRTSVTGAGEGYAKVRINYDPTKLITEDKWHDADALAKAKAIADGYCSESTYTCTKMPSLVNGCAEINGYTVCESDFNKSPLPDISPMCQEVAIDAKCGFYKGEMECYTDAQGQQQCPENSDKVCAVNHSLKIKEIPFTAKIATEDTIDIHEVNRMTVDFLAGTYSGGLLRTDGKIDKVSYDAVCGKDSNGAALPNKIALMPIELWTDHKYAPNTLGTSAVKVVQMPTCENGLKFVVDISDTTYGRLQWFYAHQFKFKVVQVASESWGPQFCIDAANKIAKGQCSEGGTLKVTKGVSSGCLPINGIDICPGDAMYNALAPSPIQGIDKLALSVRVEGCVEGAISTNTCQKYEEDKSCGFISQKCVSGAEGASGECYVKEEIWDCGYSVDVPSAGIETKYQCDGPVRCLGTECYNPVDEKSSDFAYAAAALQIAMFAENDLDCGEESIENNRDCRIWKGEAMECKKAVGGWVDCCEAPDGVSLMDYVNLTMNTLQLMEKAGVIDNASIIDGAWTYGKEMIASAWNGVFASATDAAAAELTKEAAQTWGLAAMKQAIMNAAAEWTSKTFGAAAANTLFAAGTLEGGATGAEYATTNAATGTTTTAGNATFAPMLGAALSVIMWAYMIYQIANILVQIIWECEEEEFTLGAKKETKVCHFVGSYCASKSPFGCVEKREAYCCFNSPLGRIIQEQARPQLGQEWGEAENPQCEGLRIEDLPKIDWSKIDISEWIGLLQVTGHYPTVEGMDLDKLTGEGSALNVRGGRADTLERNVGRLDGLDFGDARKEAEDSIRATVGQ